MKRNRFIIGGIILFLAVAATIISKKNSKSTLTIGTMYTTAAIERGEILNTITSTGTLEPVSTVDIGTQVSGIINKVYVDYNDMVEKGQLIAELDRTVLLQALDEAIASRNRAKALFDLAEAEFRRNEPLFNKGFISEQEFIKLRTEYRTQEATLQSAEASVKKARTNLQYATIYSPIKGTVIERNIEVGQTVAASFSAPTLFVIAEDLKRMQILASVDEADIGGIHKGQDIRFSVQAFSDKTFSGFVEQVRLQPTTTQNVVTYTVVIETVNPEGLLLPGMTATVDFIVDKATDVFKAPNAALRFQPDDIPQKPLMSNIEKRRKNGTEGKFPVNGAAQFQGAGPFTHAAISARPDGYGNNKRPAAVWVMSNGNALRPIFVKTGITDGKFTEITSGEGIAEGMNVVTGIAAADKKKKKSVSLLPQPGPPGRRK